jgi:hypothetical protein
VQLAALAADEASAQLLENHLEHARHGGERAIAVYVDEDVGEAWAVHTRLARCGGVVFSLREVVFSFKDVVF